MNKQGLFTIIIFLGLITSCTKDDESLISTSSPITTSTPTVTTPPVSSSADNESTPCENGMAGIYPCNGFDFLSRISLEQFNSQSGNDNWGWTDPETGIEYVLNGLNDGT